MWFTEEVINDWTKIKVIKGIAGAAKSTGIHNLLGGNYKKRTSTIKLMFDSINRFGVDCDTICGGCFHKIGSDFYAEFREPEPGNVVLDEVLQTNARAFDWCEEYRGKCNIFILTDSHQTLPKFGAVEILSRFEDFCNQNFVEVIELTETKRAVNKETKKLYKILYDSVDDESHNMFSLYRHKFKCIQFKDMPFSPESVYLTYSNDIEEYCYKTFDIYHRDDVEFILKGCIAKKDIEDPDRYEIYCQNQAIKLRKCNYRQAANFGTITRYQGSEVLQGHKCFFIISSKSIVRNREFYTALTRCKDMDDFVIVICDDCNRKKIRSYRGKKVKTPGFLDISSKEIEGKIYDDMTIDGEEVKRILSLHISDKYVWNPDHIYIDGQHYTRHKEKEEKNSNLSEKYPIWSMLKTDSDLDYDFLGHIIKSLEDTPFDPRYGITPHLANEEDTDKGDFTYYIDIAAAYPSFMKYAPIATNRNFTILANLPDKEFEKRLIELNKKTNGCFELFLFVDCKYFHKKIISYRLYEFLQKRGVEFNYSEFIYGVQTKIGCKPGELLYKGAFRSVEEKNEIKKVAWGYMDKSYISEFQDYFLIDEQNRFEPLMISILSELALMILKIKALTQEVGYIKVDAFFFNHEENIEKIKDFMQLDYPVIPYRIAKRDTKEVIFQNFEPLPTEKEYKKKLSAARSKAYRERKKAEKLARS